MSTAGSIVVDLLMKTGSFVTDTQRAEKSMRSLEKTAYSAGKGIGAGFASIAGIVGGALASIASVDAALTGLTSAINAADRIDELSARFSISTDTLSGWGYAAKMTGSDLESLVGIVPKFSKNIADASKAGSEADKVFKALGISVKDQEGNLRSFEDLLPEVQNRFAGMNNETTKTALAMQLFGRSGAEFLEFLSLGADGMRTMEERARSLGIVIDADTAGAAAEFNDRVDDLRAATQGWFTQLAGELLPTLTDLTSQLVDVAREGSGVRDVASGIASAFREIGQAAQIFGVVEGWLDRLRGGLVAVEKQGNAVLKLATGQYSGLFGSQGGGWGAFGRDYQAGTAYADNGWEAMQGRTAAIPDGARTGPRGRRTAATAEEIQATKDQTEQLRKAAEWEQRLQRLWGESAEKATKTSKAKREGMSEEQKTAEALARSYESLNTSMDRRLYLLENGDSEAAAVRYDIERGELQKLTAAQKEGLLNLAATIDAVEDYKAIYGAGLDSVSAKTKESMDSMSVFAEQAARNMQDAFSDFLFDPFEQGIGGLASGFERTVRKMAADLASSKLLESIGSWASSYAGAGSGWINAIGGAIGSKGNRAGGGPASGDGPYRVGEGGRPEMFEQGGKKYLIPGDAGTVRPITARLGGGSANALAGASGMRATVNIDNQSSARFDMKAEDIRFDAGEWILNLVATDIANGGNTFKALQQTTGVQRRGNVHG